MGKTADLAVILGRQHSTFETVQRDMQCAKQQGEQQSASQQALAETVSMETQSCHDPEY